MDYLNAFLCGGLLCAIGQILIDKTPLTPARILTGYVVCGVLLTAIGVYEPSSNGAARAQPCRCSALATRSPRAWKKPFKSRGGSA